MFHCRFPSTTHEKRDETDAVRDHGWRFHGSAIYKGISDSLSNPAAEVVRAAHRTAGPPRNVQNPRAESTLRRILLKPLPAQP